MKRTWIVGTLIIAAFAGRVALAEKPVDGEKPGTDKPRPTPAEAFKKLDTDADGKVSLAEFKAGPRAQKDPAKAEEIFKKRDKDSDGNLTLEEFSAGGPPKGDRPEKKKEDK